MANFINEDFLLNSDVAKKLYHLHAKALPIIDYHCHLDPRSIYEDTKFKNIVDVWLSGDHYKWRLLRANGVSEEYITGNRPDYEKFLKWAETVEILIGNPLYHWTHMELKRFFGIDSLLSRDTAEEIYALVNKKLENFSARRLIEMSNVEAICTTDDPIDTLQWHELIRKDSSMKTKVLPAFRPDKGLNIELPDFLGWIAKLAEVVGFPLDSLTAFEQAMESRVEFFHSHGCRLSDHALDFVNYEKASRDEAAFIFERALRKESLSRSEIKKYKGYVLVFLGKLYHRYGWVQQYHIGALRNVSTRMYNVLGPDTGYDMINDISFAVPLSQLLDHLDQTNELPKTIIYTLNPRDFESAITMIQAFQGEQVPGKIQFGAPWWFLDNIDGMEKHFKALGNNGLLARFVGMLTDSRSFLSYPRHEYFRRILCNFMGEQVKLGLFPSDEALLGRIVEDICYYNAKRYFDF
ncbi:MAG: glucuronate isomerase [Bacilli bacterium]|nr:glucuronate isomerase [Bacilli bacterium]MBN2697079.1 glucuronate isomerase [Bacilli bacterium]